IAAAVPLILVAAGFQFFDGIQTCATGALRGAGNTVAPFLTHFGCYWIVGLPLGILFAFRAHLGAPASGSASSSPWSEPPSSCSPSGAAPQSTLFLSLR